MAGETVVVEALNGGLVTVRDPSLLRPGELQQCDDTFYKPNDQAIWRARGRAYYNSNAIASTPTVKGLRYCMFDDADDLLIAYYGTTYGYEVFSSETASAASPFPAFGATFTDLGNGDTLDTAHYNNKYYFFCGKPALETADEKGPNHCLNRDKVMRRHGLHAVNVPPTVALATGAWPNNTTYPINKWYAFIYTEVHAAGTGDELESSWGATDLTTGNQIVEPATIYVDSALKGVQVTRGSVVNNGKDSSGADLIGHWRVYMAGPYDGVSSTKFGNTPPPLSDYIQVSNDISIAETMYFVTSSGDSVGLALPTSTAIVDSPGHGIGWVNNDNIKLVDGSDATCNSSAAPGSYTDYLVAKNFGISGITGTISGIQVEIGLKRIQNASGQSSGSGNTMYVELSHDDGASRRGTAKSINPVTLGSYDIVRLGGNGDTWGATAGQWVYGDFADGHFSVRLWANLLTGGFGVDYVKAKVYSSGGAGIPQVKVFPTVAVEVGGVAFVVGANDEPPCGSTADIFESQLVCNDIEDRSRICYSLPDQVEYFPSVYYMNFETKEQDEVTCIRRLGNKLVVGLKYQIYRVNYLPRETDTEFDRGRSYEAITERHGIIGTQAAALFASPDKPQLLAYVSSEGIHATDGYTTTTLTEDLDWEATVAKAYLHNCILVDYPKYSSLVLYYTPYGGTTNTKCLWFNYHPSHIKEGGKLLVSGPNVVGATTPTPYATYAACTAKLNNDVLLVSGRNAGRVYIEDRTADDASGIGINPTIVTRDIYPVGIGYEATVERSWARHYQNISPTMTVTVTPYVRNTESALSARTSKTFTTALLGLSRMEHLFVGECYQFKLTSPDQGTGNNNHIGISYLAFEVAAHGLEESKQST